MKMKGLALFVAVMSLIAGVSLTSCTIVEPTALNPENVMIKTALKGSVRCNLKTSASSSPTEVTLAKVPVNIQVFEYGVDDKGNPILNFLTAMVVNTGNDGLYKTTLPLAAGESYKIIVSSSSEQDNYEGSTPYTRECTGTKTADNVSAGNEQVLHIECALGKYPYNPEK